MDCPNCRSTHMIVGPEVKIWFCIDCGYRIKEVKGIISCFGFVMNVMFFLMSNQGLARHLENGNVKTVVMKMMLRKIIFFKN